MNDEEKIYMKEMNDIIKSEEEYKKLLLDESIEKKIVNIFLKDLKERRKKI